MMIKHFALLSMGLLFLSGCTVAGVATGAGAAVGISAAQEGGLSRAARDLRIQAEINDLWFQHDTTMFRKLDMTIQNGRVLLTGVVQDPEHRVEAVRLAWQPEGVEQVINEIQVAESGGVQQFALDSWVSARLRTALTFDKDVQSINYTIDTVEGIVYLMGVAQSQAELNRVIEIARTIDNVNQVVSYVKIAGTEELQESSGWEHNTGQPEYAPNDTLGYDDYDAAAQPVSLDPVPLEARAPAPQPEVFDAIPTDRIEAEELLWND